MPLTLDQYADHLDSRRDLLWPQPPAAEPAKARPHAAPLPGLKAILWTPYGTLLTIFQGELLFEHPNQFVMETALDKTIAEFKMWASMSRKPGQPADYMKSIYDKVLLEQRSICPPGERHPEVVSERVWEAIIKKLFQKEYQFDAGFYGALNEYSRKVAYFFHASLQGTGVMPGAAEALTSARRLKQVLCGDGQCFTPTQLRRALRTEDDSFDLDAVIPAKQRVLSHELRARKPSETLFRQALAAAGTRPDETLAIGSHLTRDLLPAKRLGMKTALFAGDKTALAATAEQLKDPNQRPDRLLTELSQLVEILS